MQSSYSRANDRRSPRSNAFGERSAYAPGGQRPSWKSGPPSAQGGYGQSSRGGSRGGARPKQFIHPSRFIQEAKNVETASYVPVHAFEDFGVQRRILENTRAKGFTQPSAIQDQVIPLVMQGKDVVGIANTGTGKTAAFAIPMIDNLILNPSRKALIMAPTRELAEQIMEECFSFGKGCGLRSAVLIGGASMGMQKRDLRWNPRVVVGTPGRIKDHVQQGTLNLAGFDFVVLDEVDRMLDMGFVNDITSILSRVSQERQSLFFSATMEPGIARLIERFGRQPVTVTTKTGSTVDSVSQDVVYYSSFSDKLDKLHDLLIGTGGGAACGKTIIFDDTKRAVDRLGQELHARGFKVDEIHGDKSQAQRSRAIARLKSDEISILVATDVAARGIDVSDITHVINYSTPNSYDDYVHRIGRTGRAGKTGVALTFLPGRR